MLSLVGFATIGLFLVLIITKRLSVLTALVLVPVIMGFLAGFGPKELGEMVLTGIKQVAPTGILLMFAVLYFGTMLDVGLFDPIIAAIIRYVKGDSLKVIVGTSILTMIVHLDGEDYELLRTLVTTDGVKNHLRDIVAGEVIRYELPNLPALQFVCQQALTGGVTTSLTMDTHGKSLSYALLEMEIDT